MVSPLTEAWVKSTAVHGGAVSEWKQATERPSDRESSSRRQMVMLRLALQCAALAKVAAGPARSQRVQPGRRRWSSRSELSATCEDVFATWYFSSRRLF